MSIPDSRTNELGRRSFMVVRTLGEGAFGSVFLADMVSAGGFKKRVALKLLNSSWDPESDAGRRLRDEARLLGRLQHRHIVRVDDLLQLGGRWALLMEYIAGLDVETLFVRAKEQGKTLPVRAMMQICSATAAALDAAYAAEGDDGQPLRVVHRDIKPSNVRLSATGEVKVLDFGVARAEFVGREAKTERVRYGSLGYMAPERILGEPETSAGDVYSLGAMLYELVTLETYGRAELAPEKQAAQVGAAVELVRSKVGDEVAAIVKQCLAYDVGDRPTPKEVEGILRRAAVAMAGEDIQDFAAANFGGLGLPLSTERDPAEGMMLEEGNVPAPALRTGPVAQTVSPTLAVSDLALLEDEPVQPKPNRLPVVVALVVGAVAVFAGVAWAVWGGGGAAEPAPPEPVVTAPVPPPVAPPPEVAAAPVPPPEVVAAAPPAAPAVVSGAAKPKPKDTTLSTPVASTPVASTPVPEPVATPVSSGPRLRSAKFVLTGGEGISVVCGDIKASGTTNALLGNFPAGSCSVSAGGARTSVTVESPGQINCTLSGDALACR